MQISFFFWLRYDCVGGKTGSVDYNGIDMRAILINCTDLNLYFSCIC